MSVPGDDDFDFSEYDSHEPDEETLDELRREDERIHNMPLMRSAYSLLELTRAFVATIKEDELGQHYREMMLDEAMRIPPRIAGAESAGFFSLKMENAVLVKVSACNLLNQAGGLKLLGFAEEKYLELIRTEIDEFRELFVLWVRSFDRSYDIPDNWMLF